MTSLLQGAGSAFPAYPLARRAPTLQRQCGSGHLSPKQAANGRNESSKEAEAGKFFGGGLSPWTLTRGNPRRVEARHTGACIHDDRISSEERSRAERQFRNPLGRIQPRFHHSWFGRHLWPCQPPSSAHRI